MTSCNGITVKSISTSKVYLKGTITGLDNSKQYCLHYYSGGWKNLPGKTLGYTFFSNRTSYDLEAHGNYVPTSDLDEGKQFEVRCHEVNGNCETQIREACTKILYYKVINQFTADFLVRDESKKTVSGVRIDVAGEVLYTDKYGGASIVLDAGHTYYAQCYAPDGYKCDECSESFYLDSDHYTAFWLTTVEDSTGVTLYIHVLDQSNNPVSCRVKIPGATAPNTRSTGSDGIAAFNLDAGVHYVASVQPLSGYTLSENSSASFQAAAFDITLHVTKNAGGSGAAPSTKNIPPEISAVMPAGTTRILIMNLKPLSWANFSGLKSDIPWLVEKVASIITTGGFIGWKCLGVDVVKTSDNKTLMPIFLRRS